MPTPFKTSLLSGSIRRFARDVSAVTAVEFAFVAPIFVALLLAILQVSIIFLAQSYLDEIAETTARQILTNQTYGMSTAAFKTQLCSNVTTLFNCSNMVVSLQTAPTTTAGIAAAMPTFNANGTPTAPPPLNTSLAPNTTALFVVEYQWPVIAGPMGAVFGSSSTGDILLTSTQVFQTETCTNSSTC